MDHKVGDAILLRRASTREISLGWVKGEYEYNPKLDPAFPHIRKVQWVRNEPRTRFSQGALYEIGAIMAFFQVKNYADEFLAALEKRKSPTPGPDDGDIGPLADDIERQSKDFVLKQLSAKLKGHGLAASINPIPPIAGAATPMGHGNNFHSSRSFPKKDEVGKPLEYHPARAKCVFTKLAGVISNSFDRAVKLIQEHFRSPHTAPPIPFSGGFGFLQSGRVNSNECAAH
jgi:hypothetical protein